MIKRTNIINLLAGRQDIYHSVVLTCYSFDPIFFEGIYLPTLRQLGVVNCVVLMDGSMYDKLTSDPAYSCHKINTHNYTLVRQTSAGHGAFHPKLTLLIGESECAVLVGSGNLTFSGISQNEEVWNAIHVNGAESLNFPILKAAWEYVQNITQHSSPLVRRQLDWMAEQTDWLGNEATNNSVKSDEGETITLAFNDANHSIMQQLEDAIGDAVVNGITAISPFYDTKGDLLAYLKERFKPASFRCVLDLKRQSAPFDLIKESNGFSFEKYAGENASNPLHAKIFEFQTDHGTWLLSGSANAGNNAFGRTNGTYNDEVCVLIHNPNKRDYVAELGFGSKTQEITSKDKEDILANRPQPEAPKHIEIRLYSCELTENALEMRLSDIGREVELQILDNNMNMVHACSIVTEKHMSVPISDIDINKWHMAVLAVDGKDVSNRCLVIAENFVETCNPDPKRRKLSSLLDDKGLFDNMSHILSYIEFEEKESHKSQSATAKHTNKEEEVIIVSKEDFDVLKDRSMLNISMHNGVRILTYLQQIFFKQESANEISQKNDDELLEISHEEESGDQSQMIQYIYEETEEAEIDKANHLRDDVSRFLKKMQVFLENKVKDPIVQGDMSSAVPELPKLIGKPGLNAGSSMSTAAYAVAYLMKEFDISASHRIELVKQLTDCAGYFFSLYSFNLPDKNTNIGRKTLEILKDASTMLLIALSHFDFKRDDRSLVLTTLNCLNMWERRDEDLREVISTYRNKLSQIDNDNVNVWTTARINEIINTFINHPAQVQEFEKHTDYIYMYRGGYGYFLVDSIDTTDTGWTYKYHRPGYEFNVKNLKATKYKGYSYKQI